MALQVCYNLLDACLSERKQRESMENLRWTSVYRREDAVLTLHKTLNENDVLQSPLLQGFSCRVGQLFTSAF